MDVRIGDILRLKKEHPCGSTKWLVERVGADFKIKCLGCSHEVMVPREKIEKRILRIIRQGEEFRPV